MNNSHGWDIEKNYADDYINACKKIFENDEDFLNFKSNEHYQIILEHVDQNLGMQYFEHIGRFGKDIFDEYFSKFIENDSIGNPNLYSYDNKMISPTTLRYIKNTLDLADLCCEIEIEKVVEVGGGYGGLCKTISVLCDFDEYIHVDLPDVIKVQEKYLKNFPDIFSKIKFNSCDKLNNIDNVDLFISNYSLSELNIDTQMLYYDKIIKNSKMLYITYNMTINNAEQNYQMLCDQIQKDGFVIERKYMDYGYHNNIIISAKKTSI